MRDYGTWSFELVDLFVLILMSRDMREHVDFITSVYSSLSTVATQNVGDERQVIPDAEDVLTGKVDVWVPSKKFALEVYPISWSDPNTRIDAFTRGYLRDRLVRSREAGIRLIQFFQDEWEDNRDVCESIILNALGLAKEKLNGRDCDIVDITSKVGSEFCDKCHISGGTRSRHHYGLIHRPDKRLVGYCSTRTPIQKKHGKVCELARMCFAKNVSVRGGAFKLLNGVIKVAKQDGFEGVLSYAELRHGTGKVYEKFGFDLAGETTTNYWYSDGKRRYDRFKFRAQPGKPEKVVAEENNVRSVWGAGNRIYLIKF